MTPGARRRDWAVVCAVALGMSIVLAASPPAGAAPADTTPTPTTPAETITVPAATPPAPGPAVAPDPAPTAVEPKTTTKPAPSVTHAPVVPARVYVPPAAPAVAPATRHKPVAHVATKTAKEKAKKKRHVKATPPKHHATADKPTKQSAKPAPVLQSKPRRPAVPVSVVPQVSHGGGSGWIVLAVLAALGSLLVAGAVWGTRRALRGPPAAAAMETAAAAMVPAREPAAPAPTVDGGYSNGRAPVLPPIVPVPVPVQPNPAAVGPSVPRCTIVWWRGYVRSQFLARVDGSDKIAAESPAFAWRSSTPPPPSGPALTAHERLVSALLEQGWEQEHTGATWFDATFRPAVREHQPEHRHTTGRSQS